MKAIGISPDPPGKMKQFDDQHSLGFSLLSDPDHRIAEAYGAWGEKNNYGKITQGVIRSAFLIDEQGKIMNTWYKISPKDTIPKVLEFLRR